MPVIFFFQRIPVLSNKCGLFSHFICFSGLACSFSVVKRPGQWEFLDGVPLRLQCRLWSMIDGRILSKNSFLTLFLLTNHLYFTSEQKKSPAGLLWATTSASLVSRIPPKSVCSSEFWPWPSVYHRLSWLCTKQAVEPQLLWMFPMGTEPACLFSALPWLHPFILSGVISLLISSSILGTYRPGEFLFLYPIIFTFWYCSWGSKGKNTEVVCHSLLHWTTFCQTSPPWPARLGWPHGHGLVSLS